MRAEKGVYCNGNGVEGDEMIVQHCEFQGEKVVIGTSDALNPAGRTNLEEEKTRGELGSISQAYETYVNVLLLFT
jgi:nucleotide-binding universal stress UspA family protein